MKPGRIWLIVGLVVVLLTACGGLSSKQQAAVDEALKALKKVDAATSVGVNYQQYGSLVIDAKASVNEASALLPDGELKKELAAAMEAYADAADAWQWKVRGIGSIYNQEGKLGQELFPKYSFDAAESVK
jgi:hypothetical protein